jgi:hypothetical protein
MFVEAITIIGVPIVRGVAGWLEKALADGKIEDFEWQQLAETVLMLGVPAAALFFGIGMPVGYAVALPLIADYIYHYVKKVIEAAKVKK